MTGPIAADPALYADRRVVKPAAADDSFLLTENPARGEPIAAVRLQSTTEYDRAVQRAGAVAVHWRRLPAPKRGEIVRLIGRPLRPGG